MAKKVKYNEKFQGIEGMKPSSILVYEIDFGEGEKGYSTFSIPKEDVIKIAPKLLEKTEEMQEITDNTFKKLFEAHRKSRYDTIKIYNKNGEKVSVDIDKGTKKEVLNDIIEAYQKEQPIYIEYKEGYASYPIEEEEETAIYSENGEAHVVYIGLSTGKKKIFLSLTDKDSMGGEALMTSPIQKTKTSSNERVLYKEIEKYNKKQAEEQNNNEEGVYKGKVKKQQPSHT